jgi:hypothetical protein
MPDLPVSEGNRRKTQSAFSLRRQARASAQRGKIPRGSLGRRRVGSNAGPAIHSSSGSKPEMAIFSVAARRRRENLKITQGGWIWAVRTREGLERQRGASRQMPRPRQPPLPAIYNPHWRRRTRPRPSLLPHLPDLHSLDAGLSPHRLDHLVPRKYPSSRSRSVPLLVWCFR